MNSLKHKYKKYKKKYVDLKYLGGGDDDLYPFIDNFMNKIIDDYDLKKEDWQELEKSITDIQNKLKFAIMLDNNTLERVLGFLGIEKIDDIFILRYIENYDLELYKKLSHYKYWKKRMGLLETAFENTIEKITNEYFKEYVQYTNIAAWPPPDKEKEEEDRKFKKDFKDKDEFKLLGDLYERLIRDIYIHISDLNIENYTIQEIEDFLVKRKLFDLRDELMDVLNRLNVILNNRQLYTMLFNEWIDPNKVFGKSLEPGEKKSDDQKAKEEQAVHNNIKAFLERLLYRFIDRFIDSEDAEPNYKDFIQIIKNYIFNIFPDKLPV